MFTTVRRSLAGVAVMLGLAAAVATAQLWLARWSGILDLAAAYHADVPPEWGNDEWPPQLFVIAWCAASAVVTAAAAAAPLVRAVRWRYALAVVPALAALAPLPLLAGWASTAGQHTATAALVRGAVVGAVAAAAVLAWPAAGRSSLLWVGWVELNAAATVLTHESLGGSGRVPDQPLGVYLWGGSKYEVGVVALLPGLALAGVLAWWARRRGERFALLGAVAVPSALAAVHLALLPLHPGVPPGTGFTAWSVTALLGSGAAALGTLVATAGSWARRERWSALIAAWRPAPAPAERPHPPARLHAEERPPTRLDTEERRPARLHMRQEAPLVTRRALAGAGAALAAAAFVATVQLLLGRRLQVIVPDQDYSAGNDTWPFQLVLLTWCAACAAMVGGIAGGTAARDGRARYLAALAAAAGALAPLPLAAGWAKDATDVAGDPGSVAAAACLVGVVLGASVAAAAGTLPGIGRSATAWTLLVWGSVVAEVVLNRIWREWSRVVPTHPLGLVTPGWLGDNPLADLAGLLPPVVLAAALGRVAARRSERWPVFVAVVGPLLVAAVHLVVSWLPRVRMLGDHYVLGADFRVWLLLSALAFGAASLGSRFAGQPRPQAPDRGERALPRR